MSHFLGRQGAYAADLIAAAEPALAALARELHEHLVISVLRQDRLFMVAEAEGDQVLQVRRDLMLVDDAYRTANGRLLLAFLDESELQGFLRLKGLPGAHWPQAEDEPRLRHQLQAIREQGHYADVRDGELARLAFPIRQRGRVVAALGLYAPEFRFRGKQKELCSRRLPQTADAISQALA
jgi:DNA-binding IclR family transcriptional regulator